MKILVLWAIFALCSQHAIGKPLCHISKSNTYTQYPCYNKSLWGGHKFIINRIRFIRDVLSSLVLKWNFLISSDSVFVITRGYCVQCFPLKMTTRLNPQNNCFNQIKSIFKNSQKAGQETEEDDLGGEGTASPLSSSSSSSYSYSWSSSAQQPQSVRYGSVQRQQQQQPASSWSYSWRSRGQPRTSSYSSYSYRQPVQSNYYSYSSSYGGAQQQQPQPQQPQTYQTSNANLWQVRTFTL